MCLDVWTLGFPDCCVVIDVLADWDVVSLDSGMFGCLYFISLGLRDI